MGIGVVGIKLLDVCQYIFLCYSSSQLSAIYCEAAFYEHYNFSVDLQLVDLLETRARTALCWGQKCGGVLQNNWKAYNFGRDSNVNSAAEL